MKDTVYSYLTGVGYDRDFTVKGKAIRCISPKKMRELYPEGGYKTVGEMVANPPKAKKGQDPERSARSGTLRAGTVNYPVFAMGNHAAAFYAPAGYVKVGDDKYVVLLKSRLAWLPWFLFFAVFAALLIVINFRDVWFQPPDPGIIEPSYEDTPTDPHQQDWDDPQAKTVTLTDYVRVKVPLGTVEFLYDLSDQFADGPVQQTLSIAVDDVEGYVLCDHATQIVNGRLPDTELDWDLIHVELKPGTYVASLLIKQIDPETGEEKETYVPLTVQIVNAYGGTISIGYSADAYVNLTTGNISMRYQHAKSATHNAILQMVIDSGDTPYVIATSGVVTPGHELTTMMLDPAYTRLLKAGGVYDGRIRVNYYSDENELFNFNTDIIVKIHVSR